MTKISLTAEKMLAEALPHGVVVLNHSGDILWVNAIAGELLQLPTKKSSNIFSIIDDKNFTNFVAQSQQDVFELNAPHNKGVRLSIRCRPYLEDQQLLIVQDITHRYRLEAMRQDFIANVSHELRTPLTVFRGYLEILLDGASLPPKQLKHILEQMAEQDQRMGRLVEDLLLLSRLESAEPDIAQHEKVKVATLIRDICQSVKPLCQQHELHLDLDEQLNLTGEPHELHSAFANIIVNAVRYTPAAGKIFIRWYRDQNARYFVVKDTGIGIEAKHIERITQRFYRVDSARSRGQGGTGLGLAIVKHVLLRHGGDLLIESQPRQGSTFCCRFLQTSQP